MSERVLLTMGSNIEPERNLPAAVQALRQHPALTLLALSPTYESAAVGGSGPQPVFHNAAVEIETDLEPAALRRELRAIEAQLGRVRSADKYAPRPIDLDIALFGQMVIATDELVIPDPEIPRYPHLALPLADIAPDWLHPQLQITLQQIADQLNF